MIVAHDLHRVDVSARDWLGHLNCWRGPSDRHLEWVVLGLNGHFWHIKCLLGWPEDILLNTWGSDLILQTQHSLVTILSLRLLLHLLVVLLLPGSLQLTCYLLTLLHLLLDRRKTVLVDVCSDMAIRAHWVLLPAQVIRRVPLRLQVLTTDWAIARQAGKTRGLA